MIHPEKTDRELLYVGFDGPIHSFVSGWRGATVVEDPPVPGAIPALIDAARRYEVILVTERCHWKYGLLSVWDWLRHHIVRELGGDTAETLAVMAHILVCPTQVRNDDQSKGDRLVSGSGLPAAEVPTVAGDPLPDSPCEPGGDSQHL
jgi:hypothetical protein